jgi:uncharacterized membrane protein YhaH (DUF805 family)
VKRNLERAFMEENRLENEITPITGLRTWTHMWKHIFDYKNRASREEYWIPLLIHVEIGILVFLCSIVSNVLLKNTDAEVMGYIITILGDILMIYLIVSIVPWVSLTVRRLHDTGKSGWWTFLLLAVGIGTIIILFFCSLQTSVSSFMYKKNMSFFPENNMEEDIYGPPDMFEDDGLEEDGNQQIDNSTEASEEYVPEDNMEQTIYGPPEMFENDENTR